jgi:hypothetical protein
MEWQLPRPQPFLVDCLFFRKEPDRGNTSKELTSKSKQHGALLSSLTFSVVSVHYLKRGFQTPVRRRQSIDIADACGLKCMKLNLGKNLQMNIYGGDDLLLHRNLKQVPPMSANASICFKAVWRRHSSRKVTGPRSIRLRGLQSAERSQRSVAPEE